MDTFLQQLVNGLTAGSVYAVVALGYTMVYGIIQLINFAHGEVVMIGAMVAFTVINAARAGRPAAARGGADRHRLRDPGVHAGRLLDGAARLPAAARARRASRRSSPRSASRSSCSTWRCWCGAATCSPSRRSSRPAPTRSAAPTITSVQIAIIGICVAMMAGWRCSCTARRSARRCAPRRRTRRSPG